MCVLRASSTQPRRKIKRETKGKSCPSVSVRILFSTFETDFWRAPFRLLGLSVSSNWIGVYLVFHRFRRASIILSQLDLVLLGFTGFHWVLLGFTGFYWVLLGSTRFYWVLLGFTGFDLVFTGFHCVYWVLLGFPGF